MTTTRILLASTAFFSLGGLGLSHAAPFTQAPLLNAPQSAVTQYVTRVQLSLTEAQTALINAQTRLAEAQASGGDTATAQAEVDAAEAALAEAEALPAAEVAPEAVPEPAPEPEPVPTATPEPAPAPEAEVAPAEPDPVAEPAAEAPVEQPAAIAEEAVPAEAVPEPAPAPEPAAEAPTEAAPAPEAEPAPVEPDPVAEPAAEAPAEQPAATAVEEAVPAEAAPEPEAAAEPEAAPEATAEPTPEPKPEPTAPAAEDATAEPAPEAATSAEANAEASTTADPATQEVLILPVEGGAPVLDSAKEEPVADDGTAPAAAARSSEPAAPPPSSDSEAQSATLSSEPAPQAFSEPGERLSAEPAPEAETSGTIINQYDNRTIIQIDNRTIIEHDERDRLRAGSEEVYYERLSGGRVREVIVRPNGVQLVTITNRWGEVIQRSRVMPDGREYVLFYANVNNDGARHAFVDPGRTLPALQLQIPIGEYILVATDAEPSAYLEFLMEPPVEQVERLYTVEEVRRSARIRDKVRRIDLDILTFEFGKATIAEDQVQRLSDVAAAMTKILDRNPAETFLIEGHTDAVGRDDANLLLSDRRAETIAVALSDVFGIPPENLVTQGYGERYLKVRTEAPERLNRRVTIRRITPLVTPVASR